jgi:endo-1,3-1,4-beta-glycanase ExoK
MVITAVSAVKENNIQYAAVSSENNSVSSAQSAVYSGTSSPAINPPASLFSLLSAVPTVDNEMDGYDANWENSSWSNGNPFANTWHSDHVSFNNGVMSLQLNNENCPSGCDGKLYASGEYRTTEEKYKYGYYEVSMKAAKGNGLVSGTFFTYAGTWGEQSHNEIDFEVLGKDPTKVQLNYYYAGTGKGGQHEKLIDLGFDASQGFHNYGFVWKKDSIEWYVDGKLVHRATTDIPKGDSKIMLNMWPGTQEVNGWLNGPFKYLGPVQAEYDWVKYAPLGSAKEAKKAAPEVKAEKKKEKGILSWKEPVVTATGNSGNDGPEVNIKVTVNNLPKKAFMLRGFISTNQDWPAGEQAVMPDTNEYSFSAYLYKGNKISPFYIKVMDIKGNMIERIPKEGTFSIPLPK